MIESNRLTFSFTSKHILSKDFILFFYNFNIFWSKRSFIFWLTNYRFHTKFSKSEICHMEYIISKVRISMSKCSTHIVIFTASCLNKFLELRNYNVIAASTLIIYSKSIIYFFSTIKRKNYV